MSDLTATIAKAEAYLARFKEGGVMNHIGGQSLPALSGDTFQNHSPVDEGFLCHVARSGAADIDAAARAAQAAFAAWRDMPATNRKKITA